MLALLCLVSDRRSHGLPRSAAAHGPLCAFLGPRPALDRSDVRCRTHLGSATGWEEVQRGPQDLYLIGPGLRELLRTPFGRSPESPLRAGPIGPRLPYAIP